MNIKCEIHCYSFCCFCLLLVASRQSLLPANVTLTNIKAAFTLIHKELHKGAFLKWKIFLAENESAQRGELINQRMNVHKNIWHAFASRVKITVYRHSSIKNMQIIIWGWRRVIHVHIHTYICNIKAYVVREHKRFVQKCFYLSTTTIFNKMDVRITGKALEKLNF